MKQRKKTLIGVEPTESVTVERLSHDGRGIANVNGKTLFLWGALPGEVLRFRYERCHAKFDEGVVTEVLQPSASRVTPRCTYFGLCGGCQLQHWNYADQWQHKQQVLLDLLAHQANMTPARLLPPLVGEPWGYRHKARLSLRHLTAKAETLVGFRERAAANKVARMSSCEVLHPAIGRHIDALSTLVASLTAKAAIPQLEIAVDDTTAALIIRHLTPFTADDLTRIAAAAAQYEWRIYLQPQGPDSIQLFYPPDADPHLSYELPAYQLTLQFQPQQFTQVNHRLNPRMIDQALQLLELTPADQVLDLFAGIGNFTLPLARSSAQVTAVEGCMHAVRQGQQNAILNQQTNVDYYQADLFAPPFQPAWAAKSYDKLLLDPPRAGALAIIPYLSTWRPKRLVYVSCDPATFVRDAVAMVGMGYRLEAAGIIDMFAQTQHMEVMGLFL